jgi:hypothetical protein
MTSYHALDNACQEVAKTKWDCFFFNSPLAKFGSFLLWMIDPQTTYLTKLREKKNSGP